MQWSQIKTLFILCFLVLDIYLVFQFLEKKEAADLSLFEPENATLEDRLSGEKISIKQLPEAQPDDAFISVKQKSLSKDQIKKVSDLPNQRTSIIDDKFILSYFKKPFTISGDDSKEDIRNNLRKEILNLDDYQFGEWNKDANVILYFQTKNNRPVYYNQSGMIAILLDDDNKAMGYFQSILNTPEKNKDKKTLMKPMDAIGKLYENNELNNGDEVSEIKMGYHTVVPLTNGVQVFAPTWKVTVNDKRSYFVNAIEGVVTPNDDVSFVTKTIDFIDNTLGELNNDTVRKKLRHILEQKTKLLHRGDAQ